MASNNRLYRNFVILQEDERGYSNSSDKTLSGYSKIEAKGDKCKISFYAQNLKKDNDNYYMMIICCKKDMKQIVNLGPIEVTDTGKAEATKEYNVSNIGGLNIQFDKISGTSIAKIKDGIPAFVMSRSFGMMMLSRFEQSARALSAIEATVLPPIVSGMVNDV